MTWLALERRVHYARSRVAKLLEDRGGLTHGVPARMLVGRSPSCFMRCATPEVSGEHALVQWAQDRWVVRDLGSRNGTYLDGRRLEVGVAATLQVGSKLAFGDPAATFTVLQLEPPAAVAVELSSRRVVESSSGLLAMPSADEPEVVIFQADDGTWMKESKDEAEPVADQEVLHLGQQAWCLFLPGPDTVTPLVHSQLSLSSVTFRFQVSRDEEHVVLELAEGTHTVPLEPREHHYVLLTLARQRAGDAGLPRAERGWIDTDDLQRMLRMRANALNVAIHRARAQLAEVGMMGAAGVVEVRRGLRRFGSDRLEITAL